MIKQDCVFKTYTKSKDPAEYYLEITHVPSRLSVSGTGDDRKQLQADLLADLENMVNQLEN